MLNGDNHLTQPNIHKSKDKDKLKIDMLTDDHERVEHIGKNY